MKTPSSDLLKIRALNGSQHFAFEELCCQLASLEPRPEASSFIRKGRGADAGVECFIKHKDGSETGWQAKFFDCFGSGQISQLSESFNNALEKHPDLTKYIVCLPIDFKDGRTGKEKTEGQRWNDWKTARLAEAKALGRSVEIDLWQATNIRERLYRNDPHYSGRMCFFFNETHLSSAWLRHHFEITCKALGSRYTPHFHVSLPIRQAFFGISRHPRLDEERENWFIKLRKQLPSFQTAIERTNLPVTLYEPVIKFSRILSDALNRHFAVAESYPREDWNRAIILLKEQIGNCCKYLWDSEKDAKTKDDQEHQRSALHKLFELDQALDGIDSALKGDTWRLANEQAVLIYGEAGSGKSHLLADITADAIKNGYPAILLINSQFFLQDPHTQILECLDLRGLTFSTFLGALDAAGQAAGVRTLLMIDALNERHGIQLWREYLAPLIAKIKAYKHIALVVSCRTTYLEFLFSPDSALRNSLPRLEHPGFADGGGRAAREYLAQRKIVRPSAPNLLPEFNNPLFLKTCCDSLERKRLNSFPRGLQGLTQYFEFYLSALVEKIEARMGLAQRQKIVERALNKFTESLLNKHSSYLPFQEADSCIESVFPSMGQQDRSLLSELEHEGILTIEPIYVDENQQQEHVRFTFERFSDFQIARHLLQLHLQAGHGFETLETGSPLYELFIREDIYRFTGIVEALAVILPEITGVELPELLPSEPISYDWVIENAFLESLLLRRQDCFFERTRQLVIALSTEHSDRWLTTLISVSTEPDNPFNADYLHGKLAPMSMPERDTGWSVAIAKCNFEEGSPLEVLIAWALDSGFDEIEPERAKLAATILTWLFSISHRPIRDKATKALSALLAPRLPLALTLISCFKEVDDLYILERLLAACYGAAIQAKTEEGLNELATEIHQWLFADSRPPLHLLLRDYARGIVEYAYHRGVLPNGIAIERVRPPYQSDWPIEYVGEEDLAKYTGGNAFKDDIVRSASSEWLGDFAKYIIKPAVHYWSTTTLDLENAYTPSQNFENFCALLVEVGTPEQLRAFNEIFYFCLNCRKQGFIESNEEQSIENNSSTQINVKFVSPSDEHWKNRKQNEDKFNALEKAFLALLENDEKYEYWTGAHQCLMGLMNEYHSDRAETFDVLLAQRWVTKRAHDLGWSSELFGDFDNRIGTGRGRRNKHIERIGKKYQWLALYELLARMSDNLIYTSFYSDDLDVYDGPWQLNERNIDPSLLIDKTQYDGWEKQPAVWWSPQAPKLRNLNREEQRLWLANETDQINSAALLDVTEPESGQRWLVLKSFKDYSTSYETDSHINSWCRIWCVLVKKRHSKQFVNAISGKTLVDPHAFPEASKLNDAFIGEYPWHPAYSTSDEWTTVDRDYGFRYKILPTVTEYTAEKGGYDYSLEGYIQVFLPAPWLIEKLGLRLIDGRNLYYADNAGRILFKDPSVHEAGPSAALIDKTAFLELLEREQLAPIWIIAGEKGAYGEHHDDFIGRRMHSFVYTLNDNDEVICAKQHIEYEPLSLKN